MTVKQASRLATPAFVPAYFRSRANAGKDAGMASQRLAPRCRGQETIEFAVMLGKLGYNVTMNPYTNSTYWTSVVSQINQKRSGTVDGGGDLAQ